MTALSVESIAFGGLVAFVALMVSLVLAAFVGGC